MKAKTMIAVILLSTIVVAPSLSACDKPSAPSLPNPETAVTAQMIKAKNDIKAFISAAEAYLKCVESDNSSYNAMVDEMQRAAEEFNAIVRKYKKRMAG